MARALAADMRRFDPHLTPEQIEQIARGIDEQRAFGAQLAPKKKPLANGLEPLTAVRVDDPGA
jgi:hypothetical protein